MKWVGITGRSGSGKSSVTAYLAAQGCFCADADALARQLLAPGSKGYRQLLPQLQKTFGYDIVDGAGALRRQLLADRAFATPETARALNAITHPALLRMAEQLASQAEQAGQELFFLDGAAIVGSIFQPKCAVLVLVTAPYAASVQRICARDGISEEQARRRLDAQAPEAALRAAADCILENNASLAALQEQAAALLAALRQGRLPR